MSYNPQNPNGQATSANSSPVTLASDQASSTSSAVPTVALPAGFQARTSEVAAVSNTNNTIAIVDKVGKIITLPYANPENFISGAASATSTTSTVIIAALTGFRQYITSISVMNTGLVTTQVAVQNGNGGATLYYVAAPAGGGGTYTLPSPIVTTNGNGLWFALGSASTTVYISAAGYKGV